MAKTTPESRYPDGFFFEAPAPSIGAGTAASGERRRTFSGVAYSGDVVNDGWQPIIIDLASLRLPDPCPTLLQDERDHRVGVCSLAVAAGALACEGHLETASSTQM